MNHHRGEERATRAARLLAEAGWDRVRDALLGGVCHDLNGRITSLEALRVLAQEGESLGAESLRHDLDRLEELVRVLRPLSGATQAGPGPVVLQALAEQALALARRAHRSWGDVRVEVADGVLPVRVHESDTLKALVTLLVALVHDPAPAGTPAIRVGGEEDAVYVRVDLPGEVPPGVRAALVPLSELVAGDEGRLAVEGASVTVTWPSLAALRARRPTP